ncbi:hypothetical protein CS546_03810 [Porphyromonas gingivalis]|nr:hypothetical protein CS546_03810 [Porphyromonas gingivalis]ATR97390.1 hypothetical protein CS548_10195 [Porphyromonas gingivalis]
MSVFGNRKERNFPVPLLRLLSESPWANNLTFGLSQKQTLMSTNISLFAQVVRLLPGPLIKNLSAEFQVDKHSKHFTGWQHPVCMIFSQFADCVFLREISNGLRSATGNLPR